MADVANGRGNSEFKNWLFCWKLITSVAEGRPIRLFLIPAFCSTVLKFFLVLMKADANLCPSSSTPLPGIMNKGLHIFWWTVLYNQINLWDI
jgi:hypothetical protein